MMDRFVLRPGFRREVLADWAQARGWTMVDASSRGHSDYYGRVWKPGPDSAVPGYVVYREDHPLRGAVLVLDGVDAALRAELLELCPTLPLDEALSAAGRDDDAAERIAALSRLALFSVDPDLRVVDAYRGALAAESEAVRWTALYLLAATVNHAKTKDDGSVDGPAAVAARSVLRELVTHPEFGSEAQRALE